MSYYRSDYFSKTEIAKTIETEGGIEVDFKQVEDKLDETRFGYVAVFCRDFGSDTSWEVKIIDHDKKSLKKEKKTPAGLVFIIKSCSRFAQSMVKTTPYHYTPSRKRLLCEVF